MTITLDAADVLALGPRGAVEAVRAALAGGLDPERSMPRSVLALAHGQALLMPAESPDWFGVKVATVAPDNPAQGLDRINGTYLLHDAATLRPVAVLDGIALTTLRTPAVSVAAGLDRVRDLARSAPDGLDVVVFGSGPQGQGHVETLAAYAELATVTVVTRSEGPVPAWAQRRLVAGRPEIADAVRAAPVVIAATSSREPVLDGTWVRDDALVVAVGSHEPAVRELDATLLGRSSVVVESRAAASREAGDVLLAVAEGAFDLDDLVPMAGLLRATDPVAVPAGRPLVVKTMGMGWEDLVVAVAAYERVVGRTRR